MTFHLNLGIVGDYSSERPAHQDTHRALSECAEKLDLSLDARWIPTPDLESRTSLEHLEYYHGLFCAPGGPYRSQEGALRAIRFAREKGWPFLGT